MTMKRGIIAGFFGTAVVAAFSLGAYAEVRDNPYQIIIERNPFALKPIPPPPEPPKKDETPPPPPPLDIKLTGITTLLGPPRVFLELIDSQTKKTERPLPLSEGDLYNNITILAIDSENGRVRIRNGDAETTLDFEKNGIKPTAVASAAPVPLPNAGAVPMNPAGVPAPGQPGAIYGSNPGAFNPAVGNAALGNLPPRPLRTDANNNLSITAGGGQAYNPNPQPVINQQPTLSREDAEARIEATRRIMEQQNNPQSRLMPPTALGRALGTPPAPAPK